VAWADTGERVRTEGPAGLAPGHERPHRRPACVPRRRGSITPPSGEHRSHGAGRERRQRLVGTDSPNQRLERGPVGAAAVRGQVPMDEEGFYRRPDRRDMCGGVAVGRLGEVDEGHTPPEDLTVRPQGLAIGALDRRLQIIRPLRASRAVGGTPVLQAV